MKETIDIAGCNIPIYMYSDENITYYEFDSRACEPPVPMMNALRVLELVDDEFKRMVMINMQEPTGLYVKLQDYFTWEVTPLEHGDVKIVFQRK